MATRRRLTELSMSSIHMSMMIPLRRNRTPMTPRQKSSVLRNRYALNGIGVTAGSMSVGFFFREHDRADHGSEEEDGGDLKRDQVFGKQAHADMFHQALAVVGRKGKRARGDRPVGGQECHEEHAGGDGRHDAE